MSSKDFTVWFILTSFSEICSGFYRLANVFTSLWVVVKDVEEVSCKLRMK